MSIETLIDFRNGNIAKGLGLDSVTLDKYLVYKPNRFCCIVGRPNIGKTFFQLWYFLCLSKKHGLKWGIYSIENEIWILKMYLVEFLAGSKVQDISEKDLYGYDNWINEHFKFIEQKSYTIEELLNIGKGLNVDGLFIDPYNALNKPSGNGHDYDYMAIRLIQDYKLNYGSVYINHHPVTPSQRRVIVDKDSEYFGYPDYMHYYDVEGGGKWFNACDSWVSLHRFTSHPHNWMLTSIIIEKEKVTQTGGNVTPQNQYILAEYKNNRFFVSGKDLIEEKDNLDFDNAEEFTVF
jgi:hypothetical protein